MRLLKEFKIIQVFNFNLNIRCVAQYDQIAFKFRMTLLKWS